MSFLDVYPHLWQTVQQHKEYYEYDVRTSSFLFGSSMGANMLDSSLPAAHADDHVQLPLLGTGMTTCAACEALIPQNEAVCISLTGIRTADGRRQVGPYEDHCCRDDTCQQKVLVMCLSQALVYA